MANTTEIFTSVEEFMKEHPHFEVEFQDVLEGRGESLDDVIHFQGRFCPYLDYEFTAWTKESVYFPASYDGRWWVEFVDRNPSDMVKEPVGGG